MVQKRMKNCRSDVCARLFWTLEWVVRGYVGIHRAQKAIQVDGCRPRRMSLRRFPRLFPIRNPCELRGLYRRSYFGPRTCGGGITNVIEVSGALNQGFPFSPLQCRHCRTRRGGGGTMQAGEDSCITVPSTDLYQSTGLHAISFPISGLKPISTFRNPYS